MISSGETRSVKWFGGGAGELKDKFVAYSHFLGMYRMDGWKSQITRLFFLVMMIMYDFWYVAVPKWDNLVLYLAITRGEASFGLRLVGLSTCNLTSILDPYVMSI